MELIRREDSQDLLLAHDPGLPLGHLTPQFVDQLGDQVELYKRLKHQLLRITDGPDWVDFQNKPYLQDSGIQKIAGVTGLEFGIPAITAERGEDSKGKYLIYSCTLTGTFRGRTIGDIGMASTRDPFFAMSKGKELAFDDIDTTDIAKKSVTNAQHRVLTKLLGLGGLSWDDLARIGIKPGAGVQFKGATTKAATGIGAWTPDKERVWNICLMIAQGDEDGAREVLIRRTANKEKGYAGQSDPKLLSDKQVEWLLPRLEADLQRFQSEAVPAQREPGQEG